MCVYFIIFKDKYYSTLWTIKYIMKDYQEKFYEYEYLLIFIMIYFY